MFIDTHTHIYTPEFDADRAEVVERAAAAGAEALLLPAIDEASVGPMLDCCRRWPALCRPMLGLHPTELPTEGFEAVLDRFEQRLQTPGHPFVAVGEVGVDLYWDTSRRDDQLRAFARQAGWAARFGLPLVVHSRNAHREIVDTLAPLRDTLHGGVFHCFGGTADEARELLAFDGFCLGIGGTVTFKKSRLPQVLAECVPIDRIVLETDAPYLTPTPHRGTRNEPAYIPIVIDRLADVYGLAPADIARHTTANARRVFGKLV
ncbi:MAG: TatD family hydrolase [Bacteroidaceae bacterium]|nr:TatD family hydrolase [Bacteroidaceae bacterium]